MALRKRTLAGRLYLVTGGDGRGVIVEKVLDLVADYLPQPLDVGDTWGVNPKLGMKLAVNQTRRANGWYRLQNCYRPICW